MKIRISNIEISNRRREDMGDIEGLAASIRRYGLLHPVVVDSEYRLIAGERRIRACQSLGLHEIEARLFGELSETERQEIELEENLRRKDLTPYEQARTMVRYGETVAEVLRAEANSAELLPKSSNNYPSPVSEGRPTKPDSEARIAERIGVPRQTLNLAKQHVSAGERYPELRVFPQSTAVQASSVFDRYPEVHQPGVPAAEAIKIGATLDALPEQTRQDKLTALQQGDSNTLAELAGLPPMPEQASTRPDTGGKWLKTMQSIRVMLSGIEREGMEELAARWSDEVVSAFITEAAEASEKLRMFEEVLRERVGRDASTNA